jgi:hypothetical protein
MSYSSEISHKKSMEQRALRVAHAGLMQEELSRKQQKEIVSTHIRSEGPFLDWCVGRRYGALRGLDRGQRPETEFPSPPLRPRTSHLCTVTID